MNLVLIGYMGSGKTAVGKALASALDYSFIDLDDYIEKQEANSIPEIFASKGEIYFRKKESEAITKVLQENHKLILATGGGTPCYGNTMDQLLESDKVRTIYLKASVETLTERLFEERSKRPLIAHIDNKQDLTDFIRKHLFERAPVYERSGIIVSVDDISVAEIVRQIVIELF